MPALIEGQPIYIQGSAAKPYTLKNVGGVYSCDCVSWRMQSLAIDKRTCKHLKAHCGAAFEAARIGGTITAAPVMTPSAPTATSRLAPGVAVGAAISPTEESPEEMLAAIFGKAATLGALAASIPTNEDEYKQSILDRAAAEGRNLRQDEKAKVHGPPILLAQKFEDFGDLDPTGWLYSEKLDGVRGYWNGQDFVSRQGNVFHAPAFFKAGLPNHPLDGELWMARKAFQKTISVVKRMDAGREWDNIKYVVYDAPHLKLPFEERLEFIKNLFPLGLGGVYAEAHPHYKIQSRKHLLEELARYEAMGAEGLMIRKPGSLYEARRSSTLLKVKPFKDAEATVIGHKPGKGRHKGRLGALIVRMPNGKEFDLGSGLTDAERENPPKLGVQVTYSFTELTDDGIPKCTGFIAVRDFE